MPKPVAIVGTRGSVPESWRRPTSELFLRTGRNTGNLAFQYAVAGIVDGGKRFVPFEFEPAEVREDCRLVCVPAANFLYSRFDFDDFAARLEACDLPLMVIGLGAQAGRDVAEVRLKPGTERLLRLFGERCERIVLRGGYTAAVLERYGVHNFEVLGCPSNFINGDTKLGERISDRFREARDRIAYAPTFYDHNKGYERLLLDEIGGRLAEIVCQEPVQSVALARGERSPEAAEWLEKAAGFVSLHEPAARQRLAASFRVYFCVEAWLEAYRRVDAVIGTRIHGVNLGWQAGRAACVIAHDLRTEELAETMGVPMLHVADLRRGRLLERFAEQVEACAAGYDAKRQGLAKRLLAVLGAHGVEGAPKLRALAGETVEATPGDGAPRRGRNVWGFLEQYNASRVSGWVACDTAGDPPRVAVRLDGKEAGVAALDGPRPEIGPHAWGFKLIVPADAGAAGAVRVEARIVEGAVALKNSPAVASFGPEEAGKVLVGRDGTLFLRANATETHGGIRADDLERWAFLLGELDRGAASRAAPVYVLLVPSKERVCGADAHGGLEAAEPRPVRQLREAIEKHGLLATRLLYPLEALRRSGPFPAYTKGDSRLTDYGAALALAEACAAAGGALGDAGPVVAEDFRAEYRHADLLSKLGGTCIEPQPVPRRPPAARQVRGEAAPAQGAVREYRSAAPNARGRLLFVHDDLGERLVPHAAERFRAVRAVRSDAFSAADIDAADPTAVVLCVEERSLAGPPDAFRG